MVALVDVRRLGPRTGVVQADPRRAAAPADDEPRQAAAFVAAS
jgi:hypothetical protein